MRSTNLHFTYLLISPLMPVPQYNITTRQKKQYMTQNNTHTSTRETSNTLYMQTDWLPSTTEQPRT